MKKPRVTDSQILANLKQAGNGSGNGALPPARDEQCGYPCKLSENIIPTGTAKSLSPKGMTSCPVYTITPRTK